MRSQRLVRPCLCPLPCSEDLSFEEAQKLAVRVLTKAMDTTHPSAEKMEVRGGRNYFVFMRLLRKSRPVRSCVALYYYCSPSPPVFPLGCHFDARGGRTWGGATAARATRTDHCGGGGADC